MQRRGHGFLGRRGDGACVVLDVVVCGGVSGWVEGKGSAYRCGRWIFRWIASWGGVVLLITVVTVVVHELPEGKIPRALHAASFTSLTRLVWSLSEKSTVSLRPTQTQRS
jgi:hypothetical protein